jgi:short-subunit dehydrogenase
MKRIIIVGASSGIGKELAFRYAEAGNQVGITARRAELLAEIQEQYPDRIRIACFDVRDKEARNYLQKLIEEMGGMDLFIYNAGFGEPSEAFQLEKEIMSAEINVNGCVALVGAAFEYFFQQGKGQIVLTSSVAAIRGNSWAPAYSASKAFHRNFAEGLNIKARRAGKEILVTEIRPGFVNTKPAKGNRRFWVATPQNVAAQMLKAIEQKKRVAYVTRRWWIIGQLLKLMPFWLYQRIA